MTLRKKLTNTYGFFDGDQYYPQVNIPAAVLRIIITTVCNYNCPHCFKEGEVGQVRKHCDPDFIAKVFKYAVDNCGVRTARLTGGEPLIHPQLDSLLGKLRKAGAKNIDITTTGYFLEKKLPILLKHGINPITVTLNTLDTTKYSKVAGISENALGRVLSGIVKASDAGLNINLNLTALDNLTLSGIIEVIEFARLKGLVIRICEPTYVIGADETKEKTRFKEVVKYLSGVTLNKVQSSCKSVDYIKIKKGGRVTVMRNLCDNRYCNSCARYLYLRLTSESKLKPCLSRSDTEVQIPKNPTLPEIGLAFAKAIAYMGKGPEDNNKRGLLLKATN